ncbi:hypothetical protein SSTU70S_04930 [Stutzerimonas stutzeri]
MGRYQGPQDVSSVAGQKELANRGATIAALLAMNGQLRTLAPDDAWSDRVIEQAEVLDAVRDSISASLVRAQRGAPEVSVEDEKLAALRARLEEASGAELKDVFDLLQLAGTRLTHAERVELLVREDAGEVTAALDRVQGLVDQSLEDEVAQPETMQALLAAVEQGRKAHYDYDGDYGVTLWIVEETPHGWVMKSREDGSSATATKGGAGPNRWGKDVALAAVERSAKERFSGADVVSTATAGQAEPAHYSDKVLAALVAAHGLGTRQRRLCEQGIAGRRHRGRAEPGRRAAGDGFLRPDRPLPDAACRLHRCVRYGLSRRGAAGGGRAVRPAHASRRSRRQQRPSMRPAFLPTLRKAMA